MSFTISNFDTAIKAYIFFFSFLFSLSLSLFFYCRGIGQFWHCLEDSSTKVIASQLLIDFFFSQFHVFSLVIVGLPGQAILANGTAYQWRWTSSNRCKDYGWGPKNIVLKKYFSMVIYYCNEIPIDTIFWVPLELVWHWPGRSPPLLGWRLWNSLPNFAHWLGTCASVGNWFVIFMVSIYFW